MAKGTVTIVIILAAVILAGILVVNTGDEDSANTSSGGAGSVAVNQAESNTPANVPDNTDNVPIASATRTIEITSSGFSPRSLTINKGDTVTFINRDLARHWPASNIHPTHRSYPGSGIDKCETPLKDSIFDACQPGLAQGESYTFTFNELGSWRYHDHLRASLGGTITVN